MEAAKTWVSSGEMLADAREKLATRQLAPAIASASKALELAPENAEAKAVLEGAKKRRAEADNFFRQAQDYFQRSNWPAAIALLEKCAAGDASHAEALQMLAKARDSLRDDWGIRYDNRAMPAHVLLRHWLAWLLIVGFMTAMIVLRRSAYMAFARPEGRQLTLRKQLLEKKWYRNVRMTGSGLLLAAAAVLVVLWISCDSGAGALREEAAQLESSGKLLEARDAYQQVLETKPFAHSSPATRLAIYDISAVLPERDRVAIMYSQSDVQDLFEGSRRGVSPYSVDYAPMLVSILALALLAFLLAFRLKKRLVHRFLLLVFAIPPAMVLLIEFLSTRSVGAGSIALPLSAFSRYIPYVAADASLVAAIVLYFVGTSSPGMQIEFLARRKADKSAAARRETTGPMVLTRPKPKDELPWLPEDKPAPESKPKPKTQLESELDEALAGAAKILGSSGPEQPAVDIDFREPSVPGAAPPDMSDVKAAEDLVKFLRDPEPGMRIEAARALGRLEDPKGLEPLIEALGDPQASVRSAAAAALEMIGRSDLDLIKIAHKKEKDETRKQKLGEVIDSLHDHHE
jgi:tetratricopeptide (TPR) repeat protein